MALVLVGLRLAILLLLLPYALDWRSPTFASIRIHALALLVAVPLGVIVVECWMLRRARALAPLARMLGAASLVVATAALALTLGFEGRFQWMRAEVLRADRVELERLGRHLIVGYRDIAELEALVERRAVAGVFLSSRNAQGKTITEIRREIAALQERRQRQGLPPLWIATDQEGGIVSRLSPPLTRLPAIAEIVAANTDRAERRIAIAHYAARQGRELADLGVNLNLAPVVDLDHRIVNPDDRLTRIRERAISSDPAVAAEIAGTYCSALQRARVRCTLKHFPGLGRVFEDTHRENADLAVPLAEIAATDWVPFRALAGHANALVMLSHARLVAVDGEHPVSVSRRVIAGLLRGEWSYDGLLVTDDFSMGAIYYSAGGIAGGSIAALDAGADLILVSYDPDQYYVIMHALLRAHRDGQLRRDALQRSRQRLEREQPVKTATVPGPGRH